MIPDGAVVLGLRAKGEILGTVEAHDVEAAKAAAAVQFNLDEIKRNRIMVQELALSSRRRVKRWRSVRWLRSTG